MLLPPWRKREKIGQKRIEPSRLIRVNCWSNAGQVSFKNFVGTLGAAGGAGRQGPVPWVVADRVVAPPDLAGLYDEALLLLPASFYATGVKQV